MDIKTKLNLGDKIFPIWLNSDSKNVTCEICNGSGETNIKDKSYTCPECYGSGYKLISFPTEWRHAEGSGYNTVKVYTINIEVRKGKIKIGYFPWGESGSYFKEEDCFATKEEMIAECKKRNSKTNII